MPRTAQYVYAVRFGPYLKVGLTENPKRRITQFGFQSTKQAQPADVRSYLAEPIFAIEADLTVERILHAILAPYRLTGEWYSADALAWIDPLLTSEHSGLRYRFRVDPPPKVPEAPCDCYEDDDECDCPLSGDWHVHPWELCAAHPAAPSLP